MRHRNEALFAQSWATAATPALRTLSPAPHAGHGEGAPETEEECVEKHELLGYRLASTLLALPGIPEEVCAVEGQWLE
jgi:hypothetical protein